MMGTSTKILTYMLAVRLFTLVNCQEDKPACAVIEGVDYEREFINGEICDPYMFAIDYATNTLFFTHTVSNMYFWSRYVNLKTKEYGDVGGVNGAFSHAVDSKNHQVYIGGADGIYKFDYATKNGTLIGAQGQFNWIWNMFYKNKLYYVLYPFYLPKKLYTLENGESNIVRALQDTKVEMIAVDKNDNIFITNNTGLYRYNKDFKEGKSYGDYAVVGLTTDVNGEIYFSTLSTINKIDDKSQEVKELLRLPGFNINGVAVEANGNIIYADWKNIYRLKPSKTKCTEAQRIKE